MDQTAALTESIKSERDRFVALSFCWADFLLELDTDKNIVFSAGAVPFPKSGAGTGNFLDVVSKPHRALAERLLDLSRRENRIDCPALMLTTANDGNAAYAVTGYRLEQLGNHFFMALRKATVLEGRTAAQSE
ncbi:MAG: hypothetical protein JKY20_07480, partial [Alphaproteobacteria bacterium]|nr:hypothetical protein [Alphaproteobacteria bacterium]